MKHHLTAQGLGRSALALAIGLATLSPVLASDWSATNVQIYHGTGFREPGVDGKIDKATVTLEHASGYTYGRNYFFVDSYWPSNSAALNHSNSLYGEYYHYLSLSKASGKSLAVGLLKDVNFTAGVNAGATTGGAATRVLLAGATLDFDAPGFDYLSLDLLAYDDQSTFNGVPGSYRTTAQITPVWKMPFTVGNAHLSFQGFCDFIGARGNGSSSQALCQPQLRLDVGRYFGRKDAVFVGTEFQYWKNKYGVKGLDESFANVWLGVNF